MKTLVLLFMSFTVALGMPTFTFQAEQIPVAEENKPSPVAGDLVPVQGHVVVEHPGPQVLPSPKKHQEVKPEPETNERPNEVQEVNTQIVEEELHPEPYSAPEEPVEGEVSQESDVIEEPDFPVQSEVKVEVDGQPLYELEEEEEKIDPGFSVQSEVRAAAGVHMELEPEEALALNDGDAEREMELEPEEALALNDGDAEGEMELQPEEDGDEPEEEVDDPELSEDEMGIREALEEENAAAAQWPEKEEEEEEEDMVAEEDDFVEKKKNNLLDEQEAAGEENPDVTVLDEEPMDPELQQPMPLSGNYLPEEEEGMQMYVRAEEPPDQFPQEQGMQAEGFAIMMGDETHVRGERYCPSIILDGKCHQFFKIPKNYEDAEFFCQGQFSGGHLASITSPHVHQELRRLVQQSGGYTRTWIGGRRLDSYRFIWLDGSRWSYQDWLSGEPNNTSGVENCIEIMGNGKFNDFTCWEPQAFICSYPAQ